MKQSEVQLRDICKQYRDAKRGIVIAEAGKEAILKKMESAKTKTERNLYVFALGYKQDEIDRLRDIILTFETCIDTLPREERSVIEQLYVKGRKWEEVTDSQGNLLPLNKTINIWKRAKRRMERILQGTEMAKSGKLVHDCPVLLL